MKTTIVICLAMILISQPITISAQKSSDQLIGTWADIKARQTGDELTIKLSDGKSIKGKLSSVSDTELIVESGKINTALARDSIYQIYERVPKSRNKATAIGAAVGGGLGIAAGASAKDGAGDLSQPVSTIVAAAVFAGIGALIGRAVGSGEKRVLIYQAKK